MLEPEQPILLQRKGPLELQLEKLMADYGQSNIIEKLSPFLTDQRKLKIDEILTKRLYSICTAVESPYDMHNALAIVRSSEAMGLPHIHIIKNELKKTAGTQTMQGAGRWAFIHRHKHLDAFKQKIQAQGYILAGAAPKNSMPLEELPLDKPLCLLFGNEQRGLTPEALDSCTYRFAIPMHGMVESYNLSTAAAISLYTTVARKRQLLNAQGDLTPEQSLHLKAIYYTRVFGLEKTMKFLRRIS